MKSVKNETVLTKGETHQICSTCKQEKALTEENFYKCDNVTGFKSQCKQCRKEYYQANKEKKLEYQNNYAKENKEYYKTYRGQYHSNGGKDGVSVRMKDFKRGIIEEVVKEKSLVRVDGSIEINERKFTRLVGGFGDNNPIITVKQIALLLGSEDRIVNQTINRNINSFENGTDIIDVKKNKSITQSDRVLEILNYSKQSIANSNNIYILSQSGFLLYLKFAEGNKAVELYKNFIEDYFKTKAELIVAEDTIKENNQTLEDTKKMLIGSIVMASDEKQKIDIFMRLEKINSQLISNAKTLGKEETIAQFKDVIEIANRFTNSNACYDIGLFSKILDITGMGRNNMYKWMREEKLLQYNNVPYANMTDKFKVIKVEKNNTSLTKTLLKAKGIKFIVNRLIKSGYIDNMTTDEVLDKLNDLTEIAS